MTNESGKRRKKEKIGNIKRPAQSREEGVEDIKRIVGALLKHLNSETVTGYLTFSIHIVKGKILDTSIIIGDKERISAIQK